jgi:hypothetical protein
MNILVHLKKIMRSNSLILTRIVMIGLLLLIVTIAWDSQSHPSQVLAQNNAPEKLTATPIANTIEGTATPFPAEYITNQDQTIGIALGGVLLVVIILGGTMSTVRRKK